MICLSGEQWFGSWKSSFLVGTGRALLADDMGLGKIHQPYHTGDPGYSLAARRAVSQGLQLFYLELRIAFA